MNILNTYRECVDEEQDKNNQEDDNNKNQQFPFVVLPDDVLESFPGRCEPHE